MTASERSRVEVLAHEECLRLLGEEQVGRVVVIAGGTPQIFPVNYVLDGETIVFRSDPGTKLDAAGRASACFEIDAFDRTDHSGWSVVAHGRLEEIDRYRGPAYDHVRALALEPWADGSKAHWLRLVPFALTGRRLPGVDRDI
jgi:nitroimidazol reductase NimA-like FMN-containing flavoprotein (pyridoxamine 5'-phosphate oxidase superfamily)